MVSKAVFILFAILTLAGSSLTDRQLCPDPENAKNLVHSEKVHVEAPLYGRIEKAVNFPFKGTLQEVSCVILTGFSAHGVSIASIGTLNDNFVIRLVSQIQQGFDVDVLVYTN